MDYAEVAVDAPVGPSRTFSYHIPDGFPVEPGQLVWVPFGRRTLQGIVVKLAASPQVDVTRDILQPVEPSPLLSPLALQIGDWISRYYLAGLFDSLALFLPPQFKAHVTSTITPGDLDSEFPESASSALDNLREAGRMPEADFTKSLGRGGIRTVNRLVERGTIHRNVSLPHPGRFQYDSHVVPLSGLDLETLISDGLSERQSQLLAAVSNAPQRMPLALARKEFGAYAVNALVDKGLVGLEWTRAGPPSVPGLASPSSEPTLSPTPEQRFAVERISAALDGSDSRHRSFLLHGVTGSGKTEVYLRAIEHAVSLGKQAIFLVPEISLTPQTVERVSARFPGKVAVLHSRQKPGEQFNQWWGIRDGRCDVVVGPRSALFAPLPSIGLIIIDEEHEATFKQQEGNPLYHARTVALELARVTGAVAVLGSATPDVESYHMAERGRHCLLRLPHRISRAASLPKGASPGDAPQYRPIPLAQAEVCDMREELRQGNRSIFSRALQQALRECVSGGQQAILFLNRRGNSSFVQCRDCGYVVVCSGCAVSLTYHSPDGPSGGRSAGPHLLCHQCNRRRRMPAACRQCRGGRIRQLGIGTQRVAQEASRLLPGVRVDRWDMDTSRGGDSPHEMMRRLASGESQVLVGTQMVAKGFDVPNVTLVGAVLADVGISLPDFRAGERAFGLLCQVAGRAGRGADPGRVIIQTYNPSHYAIAAAAGQDYLGMYRQEIAARREQGNPPFNRLAHLVYQDTNSDNCQRQAFATADLCRQLSSARGLSGLEVIGPAPGIPQRVRGRYRWHLTLRGRSIHRFLEDLTLSPSWTVDIDPVRLV